MQGYPLNIQSDSIHPMIKLRAFALHFGLSLDNQSPSDYANSDGGYVPRRGAPARALDDRLPRRPQLGVSSLQILVRHRTVVQAPRLHRQQLRRQPSDLDPTVHRRPIHHREGEALHCRLRLRAGRVGAHALPWIEALAAAYPALEAIRLKRMVVTDEGLDLIGRKLMNLTSLVFYKCEGFSTHGLASIAANCRKLRKLDLCGSEVDDQGGNWLSSFPNSYTSLEFLNVDCLKSDLHLFTLEQLVCRCPNLKALRLNHSFPLEKLVNLLLKAPDHLHDLGIGLFTMDPCLESRSNLASVFARFKGTKRLSGLSNVNPYYLPCIFSACSTLVSLNLTHSSLGCSDLVKLLRHSPNLQCLWVLDYIEDRGLEEVATSCKELQELRVLPSDPYDTDPSICLTERGLVSVAKGCPKLHNIMYLCNEMTNEALVTIAKHKPNLTCFRLIILEPQAPDYLTHQPLDDGYSSIVKSCKGLNRVSFTGLITDRLLEQVGAHGSRIEVLSLAFGRCTDAGLRHVLSGCTSLRKLVIRDCPFTGEALLANSEAIERLRFLWMLFCRVSYRECKMLGDKHPRLNVEVINDKGFVSDECPVENVYVYRTVVGSRVDRPAFVRSTHEN